MTLQFKSWAIHVVNSRLVTKLGTWRTDYSDIEVVTKMEPLPDIGDREPQGILTFSLFE